MAEPANTEAQQSAAKGPVLLRDRFLILSDTPLNDLSTPSTQAFLAEDRQDPSRNLYALICTPGLPPRTSVMAAIRGLTLRGILPLVEWDKVFWPPFGQNTLVVIYERPMGGRLMDADASGEQPVNEYTIPKLVIEPILAALKETEDLGITHRSIRPDNLYFKDEQRQEIVLGDLVTVPPGFDQPPIFEIIERSTANKGGRGTGNNADDLYALGITLVHILLGRRPLEGISDDDVLMRKIESGTYMALCEKERMAPGLVEPLRGLLNDDVKLRWTIAEMESWLGGQHKTPSQGRPPPKSESPFELAGSEYFNKRILAYAMSKNVTEAARRVKDGGLENWLRRGLNDSETADLVKAAVDVGKAYEQSPQGQDDFLITKVSIILDPTSPIRYKGFDFMADGFGPAMAVEILRRGDTQVPAEVISLNLFVMWLELQEDFLFEVGKLERNFAQLRAYLQKTGPGYGIERCLYEINPSLPCQSQLVIHNYVVQPNDLLPALDEAAKRISPRTKPIDRHIAAFIATHIRMDIEPHLRAIGSEEEEKSIIGMLSLLALLQWNQKLTDLLGLASWVGGLLGPAIRSYHSRTTRREIEHEIPSLVRKGSLPEMFNLIDNVEKRKKDTDGYTIAKAEFTAAEAEILDLGRKDFQKDPETIRTAHQTAAMSSIILTLVIISFFFMLENY